MKILLDTHSFIWAITDSKKLSNKVTRMLEDIDNDVHVSVISFWEISLKQSVGKLSLGELNPEDFVELAKESQISIAGLTTDLVATSHQLPWRGQHKDPFDRMLVWKAIKNDYRLISKDSDFVLYKDLGLNIVW
jgi:PIN domain nuclease of toxin-antitoxin system